MPQHERPHIRNYVNRYDLSQTTKTESQTAETNKTTHMSINLRILQTDKRQVIQLAQRATNLLQKH